jgi:hypothetical protein
VVLTGLSGATQLGPEQPFTAHRGLGIEVPKEIRTCQLGGTELPAAGQNGRTTITMTPRSAIRCMEGKGTA